MGARAAGLGHSNNVRGRRRSRTVRREPRMALQRSHHAWTRARAARAELALGPQAQKELSTVPSEARKHSVLDLIESCLAPFADVNQLGQVDHRPPPRSSIHFREARASVFLVTMRLVNGSS